jgi:hypothetical protein
VIFQEEELGISGEEGSSVVKPVKSSKTGWKVVGHRRRGVDVMGNGGGTFGFATRSWQSLYIIA